MSNFQYRLVNVFAESTFGGNPLCVFEDAQGLTDDQMQALALQFNLSETTFVLPSRVATARIRIFTPTFEMPFAGHPTLGSAHVVRALQSAGDSITLEMQVGVIAVAAEADRWTLTSAAATTRDCVHTDVQLATILGLAADDVLPGARWINTGSEQLIIPLASTDAVRRAAPSAERLATIANTTGRSMAYVFAANGDGKLLSRFFFMIHTSVIEDPGTGAATANLGGWMQHHGRAPCAFSIEQGIAVGRPCHIGLEVDGAGKTQVSGRVIEIGAGVITI